ncbi:MAG: hypothetical protein AB9866_10790 [Syntrophobacteraceae bacterium]
MWYKLTFIYLIFSLLPVFHSTVASAQDVPGLIENRIKITRHKIQSLQSTDDSARKKVLERDLRTLNEWKARRDLHSRQTSAAPAPEQVQLEDGCPEEDVQTDS